MPAFAATLLLVSHQPDHLHIAGHDQTVVQHGLDGRRGLCDF